MAGHSGKTAGEQRVGAALDTGARTPEELDTLFEDALLMGDGARLEALFEAGAVFVAGDEPLVRGGAAISRRLLVLRDGEHGYVAEPQRVLQARDLALVLAERGIAVMRRGSDDAWRYGIALLMIDNATAREDS